MAINKNWELIVMFDDNQSTKRIGYYWSREDAERAEIGYYKTFGLQVKYSYIRERKCF